MSRVSIIIPSRNEQFLTATVNDLLANAHEDIEVLPILDGYWPPELWREDPRVRCVHKGQAEGMRAAINDGARIATGDYLMKLDAHCAVSPGFDVVLKSQCDEDWVVVPRRMSLDPFTWSKEENGKSPVDAHYLSYPFERPGDPTCGLHGTVWRDRARQRKNVLLDEEMSSQGSCWFMSRRHWDRLGPLEPSKYGNFIQEFQEVGLKTWLGGGKVMVNKSCHYLHWHKGKHGRGYFISKGEQRIGADFATWYWMTDQWSERKHDLRWFIERFWPVPGWPTDLDAAFAHAKLTLRNPRV